METDGFESGIVKALFDAQGEFPDLIKDSTNPHFKSTYVSLNGVVDCVLPVLRKHGILVVQAPSTIGDQPALTTSLIHVESGTSISSTTPLWAQSQNAHGQGASITYMRRYALCAMLCLVPEEDDDGNRASSGTSAKKPAARKPAAKRAEAPADDDVGF